MSITRVLGGSSEQTSSVEEMMRRQAEKQLEAQELDQNKEQKSVAAAVRSANTNVMGNNFTAKESGPSRFAEATWQGVQVLVQQKRAMSKQIWAEADDLGGAPGGMRKHLQARQLQKELQKSNDEIREEIEKKAKEAQAPKDAEGQPIQEAGTPPDAKAPEIKAAEPAVTTGAATQAPVAQTGQPEAAEAAKAPVPKASINIKI